MIPQEEPADTEETRRFPQLEMASYDGNARSGSEARQLDEARAFDQHRNNYGTVGDFSAAELL